MDVIADDGLTVNFDLKLAGDTPDQALHDRQISWRAERVWTESPRGAQYDVQRLHGTHGPSPSTPAVQELTAERSGFRWKERELSCFAGLRRAEMFFHSQAKLQEWGDTLPLRTAGERTNSGRESDCWLDPPATRTT